MAKESLSERGVDTFSPDALGAFRDIVVVSYAFSVCYFFVSFVFLENILPEFHSYLEFFGERQIMRVSPLREKHSLNSCDVHILKTLRILYGGSHISRSSGAVLENLCSQCGESIAFYKVIRTRY